MPSYLESTALGLVVVLFTVPTMRAIICQKLGDPTAALGTGGALALVDNFPKPRLEEGTVRIRVHHASLNFPDALQVRYEVFLTQCYVANGDKSQENVIMTGVGAHCSRLYEEHAHSKSKKTSRRLLNTYESINSKFINDKLITKYCSMYCEPPGGLASCFA